MSRKILWIASAAFAVLALWAVWKFLTLNREPYLAAAATLPAELAAAKAEGLPLELADMKPRSPIKPSQNAAAEYKHIFGELDRLRDRSDYALALLELGDPSKADLKRA